MALSRLDTARNQLVGEFVAGKPTPGIHTVTFQPLGPSRNADRLVVEEWRVLDQNWLFLAVFDGHPGDSTSDYAAKELPSRLRMSLERAIRKYVRHRLNRNNIAEATKAIEAMLKDDILKFDTALINGVRKICRPNVRQLAEEDARRLAQEHGELLDRAFQGTTLALALVNIDLHLMWAAGVGDSTVALSTVDSAGVRHAEGMCELHTFKNPREYYRVIMQRTSAEKDIVDSGNRLLGWLNMSRAIGDCPFKMSNGYLTHLWPYVPSTAKYDFDGLSRRLVTPPYLTAEPSIRFVDLELLWNADPMILLFTDGVDNLVDNYFTFSPGVHSGVDPLEIVPALLSGADSFRVEAVLGHSIEPGWSRADANLAVDILGNLLGGTHAERLEMVMDKHLVNTTEGPVFRVDDTTIIVARLQELQGLVR